MHLQSKIFVFLLRTDPSPNPTLTLTCYQLTVVGLREGLVCSFFDTGIDPILVYSQIIPQYERRITTKSRWSSCHFTTAWFDEVCIFIYIFIYLLRRVTALLWEVKQLERNARLYNEEESQIVRNSMKLVSVLNAFIRWVWLKFLPRLDFYSVLLSDLLRVSPTTVSKDDVIFKSFLQRGVPPLTASSKSTTSKVRITETTTSAVNLS